MGLNYLSSPTTLCILTDKIVKEDQPTTHFNRLFDRPIRRHLKRKGKLIDWRER